jgi:hypothetical protein
LLKDVSQKATTGSECPNPSSFRVADDPNATRVDEQSSRVRLAIMPSIASSLALGFNQRDVDETST